MKIISAILIIVTVYLNISHGWSGLNPNTKPETTKMFTDLGIGKNMRIVVSLLSFALAILILFPQTFFIGNLINAAIILLIMSFALKAGNLKMALIEIPFLFMPLVMIWLGHPFKN